MSRRKEFQWTPHTHSAKGLISNYSEQLPVIVKVVQGYCGIDDDDEYAYSAGDIYSLEKVIERNKLIFKDGAGQYFSVPEIYHYRFQLIYDRGQKSQLMSPTELLNKMDVGMKVEIEDNENRLFKLPILGGSEIVSTCLGVLEYEDFYTEKVIVGRSLIDAVPQAVSVLIPDFADIRVVLATGMEGGSKEDYGKVRADITEASKNLPPFVDNTENQEIMLVTRDIDEMIEDYKSVTPVSYVRCDQISRAAQDTVEQASGKMVESDAYITKRPPPVPSRRSTERSRQPPPMLSQTDSEDYEEPVLVAQTKPPVITPPVPPKPVYKKSKSQESGRGRLPAPPPPEETSKEAKVHLNLPALPGKPPTARVKTEVKLNTKHDYVNKVGMVSPMKPQQDIYTSIDDVESPLSDDNDDDGDYVDMSPGHITPEMISRSSSISSVTVPNCGSVKLDQTLYESLAEVPEKVAGMTIQQVSNCLRLMKLDKHIDRFVAEDIDGNLLVEMDKDMLMGEFKFTAFETKKLIKFIGGWRPKSETSA